MFNFNFFLRNLSAIRSPVVIISGTDRKKQCAHLAPLALFRDRLTDFFRLQLPS
jgi:hypothetical protein